MYCKSESLRFNLEICFFFFNILKFESLLNLIESYLLPAFISLESIWGPSTLSFSMILGIPYLFLHCHVLNKDIMP